MLFRSRIEFLNAIRGFDSRDRALVWRTTGGKHRYLLGDCQGIVAESIEAFRAAAVQAIDACLAQPAALTLAALDAEHLLLSERLARFDAAADPLAIWAALGIVDVAAIPMLEADAFMALAATHRMGVPA